MDDHMTDGQEPKNQEMVSAVQEELERLKRERDEYLAGWQRAKADFINYKRDAEKLAAEVQKFAREDFIYQLLPVLDHFMFAEAHLPDERRQDEWVKGVFQIKSELEDILKREGVEVMEAMGKPFNPECHESLGALETDGPENVVVDELQRGYVLNGRVLRPAKVKISERRASNVGNG